MPIKPLRVAKSRLLGAADGGRGEPEAHAALVAAAAVDTVTAASEAPGVRQVVVITSDPELAALFTGEGVRVLPDVPASGLNPALTHGERVLRERDDRLRVGALQADLPALRPSELGAALAEAGSARAFCPDRQGTGTTLLVAAEGAPLGPRFGPRSADAHTCSGARALRGPWPSLRCDVDTEEDLRRAAEIGLGPRTTARLGSRAISRFAQGSHPAPDAGQWRCEYGQR